MFMPDGYYKRKWDWLVVLTILVSVLSAPLLLGFSDRIERSWLIGVVGAADAVWWIDILVSFRTAAKLETFFDAMSTKGRKDLMRAASFVTQPSKIAVLYVRRHLTLDLFAGLPYYLLLFFPYDFDASAFAGDASAYDYRETYVVISLLPMLVLLRLRRIGRTDHVKHVLYRDTDTNQLKRLVVLFLYLSHATGCIYWLVCLVELRHGISLRSSIVWGSGQDFLPPKNYLTCLPGGVSQLRALHNGTLGFSPSSSDGYFTRAEDLEWLRGSGLTGDDDIKQHNVFTCYMYALVWGMLNVSGVNFAKVRRPPPPSPPRGRGRTFAHCCVPWPFPACAPWLRHALVPCNLLW